MVRWTKERGLYIPPFNILRIFTPLVWVCGLASMLAVAAVLVTARWLEAGARGEDSSGDRGEDSEELSEGGDTELDTDTAELVWRMAAASSAAWPGL